MAVVEVCVAHRRYISSRWILRCSLAGVCSLVALAPASFADTPCATCENPPAQFPDAARFLESVGYPARDYTVLLTWTERPPRGDGGLVYGYHVKQIAAGATFDVYASADGTVLNSARMAGMGIHPKNWDLKPSEKEAELPPPVSDKVDTHPVPASVTHDIAITELTAVPPIYLAPILAEDAANEAGPHKGATRVGVFDTLSQPIRLSQGAASAGSWMGLPRGASVWNVSLFAPLAKGLRVHFKDFSLPKGAQVIVYNANDPSESYGPFTAPTKPDTDLWAPTCFTTEVVVECYSPIGVDRAQINLSIDQVVYVYKDFGALQWQKSAAGACNLDAACYPEWASAATGVGAVGSITSSGFIFCTGSLLADQVTTNDIPYFLTANHCVGTAGSASSIEVYWLYQRDACGGGVSSLATVPRTTGGADYLAGTDNDTGSDFALLRLRSAPPGGMTLLGWSNLPWNAGTEVTCVHHPRGDYKRISFGTLTGGSTVRPAERFFEVQWNQGTTEPGSSGSPLMLTSSQQIIGQLYGGYASCNAPNSPDTYGRFDVTYPLIQKWLNPADGPEDVNHDGVVNSMDIQLVINAALDKSANPDFDIDRSGEIDAVDVQMVINAALFL
ncbi:MAG: trypsin-like peptidase domain-containing protein [Candidatus Hydrogenedentes bacterium]|nr:trypsin-like peptidase domain-containing protein [Candidatus Hydrogenedentota bacterium]